MKDKKDIRVLVRDRRINLDDSWISENSIRAQRRLMDLPEFRSASVVCCYLALAAEVQTGLIVETCIRRGTTLCVPAFRNESARYELARLRECTRLVPGPMNVSQPMELEPVSVDDVDLLVAPGLAFDPMGGRLGHGGGHYDGIMGRRKGPQRFFKVGLAFEFQVLERVPMCGGDIRLDAVVTEERLIRNSGPTST